MDKEIRHLLHFIDIFSKYSWVIPLKEKKLISKWLQYKKYIF